VKAASAKPTNGWRWLISVLVIFLFLALLYGSLRNTNFWFTDKQRGDHLMAAKQFKQAAQTYTDPWHIGMAQYRNGDFKEAAQTFARVPGAGGAFNQGNALLMHGAYGDAVKSYDRALGFQPSWQAAEDNKALAIARKKVIDDAGDNREQESADAYKPDETTFNQKGDDKEGKPQDMNNPVMSDEALRATWLRRVQTTPSDFLQAKFAYQAAQAQQQAIPPAEESSQ